MTKKAKGGSEPDPEKVEHGGKIIADWMLIRPFRSLILPSDGIVANDTVENWTEMITSITAKNLANANLDQVVQISEKEGQAGCKKGYQFEVKDQGQLSGVQTVILVVRWSPSQFQAVSKPQLSE